MIIRRLLTGNDVRTSQDPNDCPHCHVTIEPKYLGGFGTNSTFNPNHQEQDELLTFWRCTNRKCQRVFVLQSTQKQDGLYYPERFLNGYPETSVPEPVKLISSSFFKIYAQCIQSEELGLDELTGTGLRKAIEFLARDYAKIIAPDKSETIEKAPLRNVIDQYFDDDVKELFHRGTWLGADHVHYKQYYTDFNISDLKGIIELIMQEIVREELKKKYISIKKES